MITALEVENFKGFSRRQRVELAPLTLLFGANGAGKSAVLHALLYAAELLRPPPPCAAPLFAPADRLLGGFARLVHQRDLARSISLAFEVARNRSLDPPLEDHEDEPPDAQDGALWDDRSSPLVGLNDQVQTLTVGLSVRWDAERHRPQVHRLTLGLNKATPCLTVEASPATPGRVTLALDARASAWPTEAPSTSASPEHSLLAAWLSRAGTSRDEDGLYRLGAAGVDALDAGGKALRLSHERRDLGPDQGTLQEFVATLLCASLDTLRSRLRGILHVGALRTAPAWRPEAEPGGARWTDGRGAWAALAADPVLLEETNRSLERVGCRHRLVLREFRTTPLEPSPTSDELAEQAVWLRDLRSGMVLHPSEAGQSLTALVPVLASLNECSGRERGLLLLEEPALHLAQSMQAQLGDELRRAAERCQVLVETHSELLLLRLLRRMRETEDKTLPLGVEPCHSERVKVFQVRAAEGGSITSLDVDSRGEAETRELGGFFGERAEELF